MNESKVCHALPVFVNLLRIQRIDSQPGGPVQYAYSICRTGVLHRPAESIPRLHKSLQIWAQVYSKSMHFKMQEHLNQGLRQFWFIRSGSVDELFGCQLYLAWPFYYDVTILNWWNRTDDMHTLHSELNVIHVLRGLMSTTKTYFKGSNNILPVF